MVATKLPVHPGNAGQAHAWDGEEGAFWAGNPEMFERSIAGFDPVMFDRAAIRRTDRILDVGCGTGSTTRAAARLAPEGSALGVDLSAAMLAVARRTAAEQHLTNVEFLQADAQIHAFEPGMFDVAISRTTAMFFADRAAALANIGRAMAPGGRLALVVWQAPARNEWFGALTGALAAGRRLPAPPDDAPHPFTLADPQVAARTVAAGGFTDVVVDGLDGVMDLGPDPERAYRFALGLLGWMLADLDETAGRRARRALRDTIDAHTSPAGVRFGAATWLINAVRAPRRP